MTLTWLRFTDCYDTEIKWGRNLNLTISAYGTSGSYRRRLISTHGKPVTVKVENIRWRNYLAFAKSIKADEILASVDRVHFKHKQTLSLKSHDHCIYLYWDDNSDKLHNVTILTKTLLGLLLVMSFKGGTSEIISEGKYSANIAICSRSLILSELSHHENFSELSSHYQWSRYRDQKQVQMLSVLVRRAFYSIFELDSIHKH
mgnify:CR=1 FL=1